ncbi:hypothetical protein BACCAP_00095 [Pseudoflavonifractor capillosus ATCC 29799]|uniref:Uncharacterized protein n=1 Tax=Pseudoflavonifractor capillosus ATCC 29799 TaxID=411467 RepID=A6NPI1_9FIRM|nr:hypothetical protein BACCAP_00095 [Pseudoflavonifractor capillosus ATCC 29799]
MHPSVIFGVISPLILHAAAGIVNGLTQIVRYFLYFMSTHKSKVQD